MTTILVTGASSGIGKAIALQLVRAGHTVYGTSRRPKAEVMEGVRMLPLEVTDPDSVRECIRQVIAQVGRVDVLVNNAGYDLYGAAEETTPTELHDQMDTNFYGAVRMTQAVLPHMREQGGGKIINISSIGGVVALPYNSAYAASKFALEGYSESLRLELLAHNIYVSLVEPGGTSTGTTDTSVRGVAEAHPAYSERAALVQTMRDYSEQSSLKPEAIARTVARIVAARVPGLRYKLGGDMRTLPLLKALLPQRIYERLVLRQLLPEPAGSSTLDPYKSGEV